MIELLKMMDLKNKEKITEYKGYLLNSHIKSHHIDKIDEKYEDFLGKLDENSSYLPEEYI
jgi:hypothetical protein